MIYIIEFIIFIVITYVFNNIRYLNFYIWILNHNRYVFDVWATVKENFAYKVTKIVEAIPTFSFAPTRFDYDRMREGWKDTYNCGEKILICIGMIWLIIKGVVGNKLIDLVFVITFLFKHKLIRMNTIIALVEKINFRANIEYLLGLVFENGNILLAIVIGSLGLYAMCERKKIATYQLEAIWGNDVTNVKEVAEYQKEIEHLLFNLRKKIWNNSYTIKQNIRFIERRAYTNDSFLTSRYEDYTEEIEEIKKYLVKIWKSSKGLSIYVNHNWKVLVQLNILGLCPYDEIGYIELEECNKPALDKIDLNQSEEPLKREFMIKWMHCIAQLNGITRYLQYMDKRMRRYQKMLANVTDIKEVKEIAENVKD